MRDALDGGRRDAGPIRGGAEGCAPLGSDTFELAITAFRDAGPAHLDVRVEVRPQVQIVWERLTAGPPGRERTLMETTEPRPDRSDIDARVYNNKRGRNPQYSFRATHLLTAQLALRLTGRTEAERLVLEVADEVLSVLSGVFHLDPVPHLMRQYVPEQDVVLRRTGENLSAVVARMQRDDPTAFTTLVEIVKELPEHVVQGVEIRRGGFGEVMLGLSEVEGGRAATVPTRQMSDGMLRMVAILAALLAGGRRMAVDGRAAGGAPVTLVLEELENGLHPTQAARILDVVKRSAAEQDFQVVLTTHSPALLNALHGDDHLGVIVIGRDPDTGYSRATRLVDLPGYRAMMASGRLGDVVSTGLLPDPKADVHLDTDELNRLLGIA